MSSTIALEYYKIRRKNIGLMLILFLLVEMTWAFMAISMSIARNPDHAAWEAVLFNISYMNGLFMPIVSAIVVSRICDMEHKGATWKMLAATNVSRTQLYAAKYVCANSLLLIGILAQTALMIGFGWLQKFPGMPFGQFMQFVAGTAAVTLAVATLQQWVSMSVKNQAFALCLGMIGGFFGLTAGLFPASARHLLIWSYYLDLSPTIYVYSEPVGAYAAQPFAFGKMTAVLMMAALSYIAGNIHVNRKEI